jgi:hypothetical protein
VKIFSGARMKKQILEELVGISEIVEIESDTVPFSHNINHVERANTKFSLQVEYQNEE